MTKIGRLGAPEMTKISCLGAPEMTKTGRPGAPEMTKTGRLGGRKWTKIGRVPLSEVLVALAGIVRASPLRAWVACHEGAARNRRGFEVSQRQGTPRAPQVLSIRPTGDARNEPPKSPPPLRWVFMVHPSTFLCILGSESPSNAPVSHSSFLCQGSGDAPPPPKKIVRTGCSSWFDRRRPVRLLLLFWDVSCCLVASVRTAISLWGLILSSGAGTVAVQAVPTVARMGTEGGRESHTPRPASRSSSGT